MGGGCLSGCAHPGRETFALVLVSPLLRARETCDLSGLGEEAVIEPSLVEWNYGEYEGLTPAQIHDVKQGWMVFRDGCPGGEAPDQIGRRVDRVIERVRTVDGDVALFAHGHVLRVLAARWIGLPPVPDSTSRHGRGISVCSAPIMEYPAVRIRNSPAGGELVAC